MVDPDDVGTDDTVEVGVGRPSAREGRRENVLSHDEQSTYSANAMVYAVELYPGTLYAYILQ